MPRFGPEGIVGKDRVAVEVQRRNGVAVVHVGELQHAVYRRIEDIRAFIDTVT